MIATKDIGGIARDHVPKGSRGVVTSSGWGETKVLFTIKGFLSDKRVEISVYDDEIA